MRTGSLKNLAVVVSIFFLTSYLSQVFLPVYFNDLGLSITEIIAILFFTFTVIGLLPLILLKIIKKFESLITFGIFSTMLFYVTLIYIKNPVVLGLAYGLSIATFWPSFNLLQFRLSKSKVRARVISLFSSIIPSIAGIIGPAVGGLVIQNFGFTSLFTTAIILYLAAFLFSVNIRFKPETYGFSIPRGRMFIIFFVTFIFSGFCESYWLAYPFFVFSVSGSVLYMGLVFAVSAVLFSIVTFLVNWLSDVKRARVEFAVIGTVLNAIWFFAIAFASTIHEVVALSLLSGLAHAFTISWFAHYGDSFSKEYYASILVMMEVGFMVGRIINLAPTYIFISEVNYASYFILLGVVSLFLLPLYIASKTSVKSG